MTNRDPILKIENISKKYGSKEILRSISLEIKKGETKVLIGPSGAGKSTLLQCINFLVMPDTGKVYLDGRCINSRKKKELYTYRQQVGMIFQDFNLFDHLTALENVSIGLIRVKKIKRSEANERAMQELKRVGLEEHANKYPAQLSGGQKQRVSIARALAMDPKVMLLDEPTSALDPELVGEVLNVIRNLVESGMTMLMATHQINFAAAVADEIIFMENGTIIEHGPPQEILFKPKNSRTKSFCSKINEIYGDMLT